MKKKNQLFFKSEKLLTFFVCNIKIGGLTGKSMANSHCLGTIFNIGGELENCGSLQQPEKMIFSVSDD